MLSHLLARRLCRSTSPGSGSHLPMLGLSLRYMQPSIIMKRRDHQSMDTNRGHCAELERVKRELRALRRYCRSRTAEKGPSWDILGPQHSVGQDTCRSQWVFQLEHLGLKLFQDFSANAGQHEKCLPRDSGAAALVKSRGRHASMWRWERQGREPIGGLCVMPISVPTLRRFKQRRRCWHARRSHCSQSAQACTATASAIIAERLRSCKGSQLPSQSSSDDRCL